MTVRVYRYPTQGLGLLLVIPWLAVVCALALAYLLFGHPNFLVPSTRPGGYFGLLLSAATAVYFFRFDRHRRQQFETTATGLTVISGAKRETIAWADLRSAEFRTNTGILLVTRGAGGGRVILYPAALENGAALVAEIDRHTSLRLADIADLQFALERAAQ